MIAVGATPVGVTAVGKAHWLYCACALGLPYLLKQLLGNSLMEILKPGCPGIVGIGENSFFYDCVWNPLGPSVI